MARMGTHKRSQRHAASGMAPDAGSRHFPWPLLLIAAPAAVAIWSGWVGLGGMCGFGLVYPLPGIVPWLQVNTAITLPIGVEAYGAYALGIWLTPSRVPDRAREFAKWSGLGALAYGMTGQVAFHLLAAAHYVRAPWPVVVAVSCMPVITLGFGAALTHLLLVDIPAQEEAASEATLEAIAEAIEEPVIEATPEAVEVASEVASGEPCEVPSAAPPEVAASVPEEKPAEKPAKEPRPRAVRISEDPEAKRARTEYRKSVSQGQPLSDRALAAKFGRSRTWGANRIAEVEEGPALTAQAR
jgi:hypothetical protein